MSPKMQQPSFIPSTTFLPVRPLYPPVHPARRPRRPPTPTARQEPFPEEDFFLPRADIPLLNTTRPSRQSAPKDLPIAQRRREAKRRELTRSNLPHDDDEEARRTQLVGEQLSAADLFGIVDPPAAAVPSSNAPIPASAPPDRVSAPEHRRKKGHSLQATSHVPTARPDAFVTSRNRAAPNPAGFRTASAPKPSSRSIKGEVADAPLRQSSPSVPSSPTSEQVGTLQLGQLVMHERHGVGRFRGIERSVPAHVRDVREGERPLQEFSVIEYRDGDVYVPFSHFEVIRRLAPHEEIAVSRLDSIASDTDYPGRNNSVKNRRSKYSARLKTREKIRKQLVNLQGLYAERTTIQREPFEINEEAERAFAKTCEFELTDDQIAATKQVLNDMSMSRRPMDRLICGDVGFGKTEVAIRACFRVLCAGKQVAILAPTTILAQQHFQTFRDRFADICPQFPLACLSRFVPRKQVVASREKIESGDVRIAVGTHMLLNESFSFHDLGLLIVDEEHRFGVNQKEKIRARYRGIDTLFLSATPIPRTLHLALSGLRDASVLRTPPKGRKPVKTSVSPSGSGVVRHAINQEIGRGGQVFFVVPRIEGIEATANWIRDLFPKLRILVAHGSMTDLEQRIWSFAQRQYDVLVCTTIIENGIDMPDVNTIIIQDAARFGLAQLHQLRGRVGRCDVQAYAWIMFRRDQTANTQQSMDRLKALERNSELGSGFAIAQRDMEMRGVGTVLGVEQHGNTNVGGDEYARMLSQELEHARTGKPIPITIPDPVDVTQVFLPIASLIPDEYISDFDLKMTAYGSFSSAKSRKALAGIVKDLELRYGPLPPATRRHVRVLELKLFAKPLGISRIFTERQHVILEWPIEETAFNRLLAVLPDAQSRSRCELLVDEERVVLRGLGICSGDVQLAKLHMYLLSFRKAASGLLREKDIERPDPKKLADSLSSIDSDKLYWF